MAFGQCQHFNLDESGSQTTSHSVACLERTSVHVVQNETIALCNVGINSWQQLGCCSSMIYLEFKGKSADDQLGDPKYTERGAIFVIMAYTVIQNGLELAESA